MISDKFLKNTKDKPPSKLLLEALPFVSTTDRALDLGCGAFKDTKYLLEKGFMVDAVDSGENVAAMAPQHERLNFHNLSFSEFDYKEGLYDIVNAQFALPFAHPDTFADMWSRVIGSVKTGGVFSGQLFGPEDDFSNNQEMTFFERQVVEEMFATFELRTFVESKRTSKTATGRDKFWHIFDVIAVKR